MPIPNGVELPVPVLARATGPELRPSRYKLAEQLYTLVLDLRNSRSRQRQYEKWLKSRPAEDTSRPERKVIVRAGEVKDCARATAMRLMGFNPVHSEGAKPEWSVVATFGTDIHSNVQRWLEFLGLSERSEFNVEDASGAVRGRVDHLLEGAVLDVKTVSDKDFKAGIKGYKIPGYVAQLSIYGRILGVNLGVVLLVNRNTGEMADYEFAIDVAEADKLIARAQTIVDAVRNRELPTPEQWSGPDGSFSCKSFCAFYRYCAEQNATGAIQLGLDSGIDPKEIEPR